MSRLLLGMARWASPCYELSGCGWLKGGLTVLDLMPASAARSTGKCLWTFNRRKPLHRGRGPAQRHQRIAPAFDVAGRRGGWYRPAIALVLEIIPSALASSTSVCSIPGTGSLR
jgi:hypothetical protein